MPDLKTLLAALKDAESALWDHAKEQHLTHSPNPEWPTEYVACMREPCKTIRDAINKPDDDD